MGKVGEGKRNIFSTCPRYSPLETVRSNHENERPEKPREIFSSHNSQIFYWFQYGTVGGLLKSTT